MQLHEIIAVRHDQAGHLVATVDITDMHGERYVADYGVVDGDQFGLAPTIRAAVAQWIADEHPVAAFVPPALAAVKASLKAQLDADAETERLKYVTAGAGQAMTYQRKSDEARRHQEAVAAEETIDPGDYPMLAATIGIDGATLADVATTVLAMDAAWAVIGSAIEATRLGGKAAIDAAEDAAGAQAAFDAVAWPTP